MTIADHYKRRCEAEAAECFVRTIASVVDADEAARRRDYLGASLHVLVGAGFGLCACAFGGIAWAIKGGDA